MTDSPRLVLGLAVSRWPTFVCPQGGKVRLEGDAAPSDRRSKNSPPKRGITSQKRSLRKMTGPGIGNSHRQAAFTVQSVSVEKEIPRMTPRGSLSDCDRRG